MSARSLPAKYSSLAMLLAAAVAAASPDTHAADAGVVQAQQAGEKALSRPAAPVETRAANGAVGVRVGEAFDTYSVVTRREDGTLFMQSVTGAEAAKKMIEAPPPASAKANKELGHAHQ